MKLIIGNTSPKKTKLSLVILKKQSISNIKNDNIIMINANTYHPACCSKKAQVFNMILRDF